VMEQASGRDLGWFFDEWLRRPTSPSFDGGWRYNATAKQIEIDIRQTQTGEPYRMPIEIGVEVEGGGPTASHVERREINARDNRFTISTAKEPTAVTFDPNTWLLMDQVNFVRRP